MKVARCEARSAIVENTRVRRAVSGWFASSRPECARDVIGASELLSSCAMTRITFFQIATSCAAISRVSCLKSSSRCGWLFSVKGRLLRWKISASAPSDTVNRVSTPPATASRSTCGASSSSSPKRMPSILRPARNSCRAAMLPKTMWSFALVSTSASGVVCTTVSRRSSRWYRSRRSRRRLSPSELYSAVRSPISSGPVGVTLTLKSRSRRLPMPSATARRLWLQRLNMRPVNQKASGRVTRSAAAPARTGDSSQRSKRSVTAATTAAVAATTTAIRPASERRARGLLAMRPAIVPDRAASAVRGRAPRVDGRLEAELLHAPVECLARQPEVARGMRDDAVGDQERPFDRFAVDVRSVRGLGSDRQCERLGRDDAFDRQQAGAVDRVAQLAHVARPVVAPERAQRVLREGEARLEEVLRERDDVFLARGECRHLELDDVQAVEQVLAEPAFLDELRQAGIGRGDHARAGPARRV